MAAGFCVFLGWIFVRSICIGGGEGVLRSRPAGDSGPYLFGSFGKQRAEVGEEFFEVVEVEFPFDEGVGVFGEGLGTFGAVGFDDFFDDGDDFGWRWVGTGGADEAPIA